MIPSKRIIPELLLSVGLIFMVSCSDSTPNAAKQDSVPEPPPAKSMAMDLPIFDSAQSDPDATGNHEHFEEAAATISSVQSMMSRNVNLIQSLFEQADTAEAEELSKTKWQWKFTNDEQEGQLIYNVRLVAEQQSANEIKWDLFLSSSVLQQNEEKHYLSGTTNSTVTEGVWTYYSFGRTGQPSQEIAKLDWQMDENEDVSIKVNILEGSSFSGSQLKYNTEDSVRVIELNSSDSEGTTTIKFDSETKAGFITSPDYNNGKRACWNGDFENTECSKISL